MATEINANLSVGQAMACTMAARNFYRSLVFNGHSETVNNFIAEHGIEELKQRVDALAKEFENNPELDTPERVLRKLQERGVPVTSELLLGSFLLIERGRNTGGGEVLAELLAEYAARE